MKLKKIFCSWLASNLCSKSPKDSETNALSTRPSDLSYLQSLTDHLTSFVQNGHDHLLLPCQPNTTQTEKTAWLRCQSVGLRIKCSLPAWVQNKIILFFTHFYQMHAYETGTLLCPKCSHFNLSQCFFLHQRVPGHCNV